MKFIACCTDVFYVQNLLNFSGYGVSGGESLGQSCSVWSQAPWIQLLEVSKTTNDSLLSICHHPNFNLGLHHSCCLYHFSQILTMSITPLLSTPYQFPSSSWMPLHCYSKVNKVKQMVDDRFWKGSQTGILPTWTLYPCARVDSYSSHLPNCSAKAESSSWEAKVQSTMKISADQHSGWCRSSCW